MSNTNKGIGKVRTFLAKIRWKSLLTFSFFIILASIFWVMQVYRQKFESTRSIPIEYLNTPDNIVFSSELPKEIQVRIKDDGATLFRYNLTKYQDTLKIDLSKKFNKFGSFVIQGQAMDEIVRSKLFSSSDILGYVPTQIDCSYEAMHHKRIPVSYDGYLDLASGYIQDGELKLTPDSVMAYGSKASLDTLDFAYTKQDTLFNITSTANLKTKIVPAQNIIFKPSEIGINVSVDEFTQKMVEVPVECTNVPPNITVKFFPSAVKVPCSVGLKRSERINTSGFSIIVDYNHLKRIRSHESSIPVMVTKSPDFVKVRTPIPAEVEFVLEQK